MSLKKAFFLGMFFWILGGHAQKEAKHPTLPKSGREMQHVLPDAWQVLSQASGDLNGDGQEDLAFAAQSSRQLTVRTMPRVAARQNDWDPLELEWEMGYDNAFMESKFILNGTQIIDLTPSDPRISLTEQNIFFNELKVSLQHPYKNISANYSLDGSVPDGSYPTFPNELNLAETKEVNVILSDSEGFKSEVLGKSYEKVRPSAASRPKNLKDGLAYLYYEGNFNALPDFENLRPIKSGVALELSPDKIGQRPDHYAIRYKGYIKVPATDIYTFYLRSDDGSKLLINGELVIDNDGSHSAYTKTGMQALKKGWHPIQIDYFEDFLGQELELKYSNSQMEKTVPLFKN